MSIAKKSSKFEFVGVNNNLPKADFIRVKRGFHHKVISSVEDRFHLITVFINEIILRMMKSNKFDEIF